MPGPHGTTSIGTEAERAKQLAGAGPTTSRSTTTPGSFAPIIMPVATAGAWAAFGQSQSIWRMGGAMPDQSLLIQSAAFVMNQAMPIWSSMLAGNNGVPTGPVPDLGSIQNMLEQAARTAFPPK